jgi:phospholipase C
MCWVSLTGSGNGNLHKIDHIVVLMMENRSFDHMLGYLKLDGGMPEVEGLQASMANEYDGRSYPVHPLGRAGLEGSTQNTVGVMWTASSGTTTVACIGTIPNMGPAHHRSRLPRLCPDRA